MPITTLKHLKDADPAVYNAIAAEAKRQVDHVELIASENYPSRSVLEATGSCLTNKYAEGYPGARYYGGCEHVDVIENLAIERAKSLFSAEYANVQPHSGSSANMAVFLALLQPGDAILGMRLDHGGHLTHGTKVNYSGVIYNAYTYGINLETGDIDYEGLEKAALECKPKMIIAGFSAFSGVVDWERFRVIADKVGAYLLADMAHVSGLIAAGVYPSPIPHAHVVTSTTHKTLRGPRSGIILSGSAEFAKQLNFGIFPMLQGGPLMHVIAAKAIAFKEAASPEFKVYQQRVIEHAKLFAATLMENGLDVVSNGTENHMFLVDLSRQDITGKFAESVLGQANITVNKNAIPGDVRSPFVTSGIRIGTAAITTRGFGKDAVFQVAKWTSDILSNSGDLSLIQDVQHKVKTLCQQFPVYPTDVSVGVEE